MLVSGLSIAEINEKLLSKNIVCIKLEKNTRETRSKSIFKCTKCGYTFYGNLYYMLNYFDKCSCCSGHKKRNSIEYYYMFKKKI